VDPLNQPLSVRKKESSLIPFAGFLPAFYALKRRAAKKRLISD
jgi:hypothetical protein